MLYAIISHILGICKIKMSSWHRGVCLSYTSRLGFASPRQAHARTATNEKEKSQAERSRSRPLSRLGVHPRSRSAAFWIDFVFGRLLERRRVRSSAFASSPSVSVCDLEKNHQNPPVTKVDKSDSDVLSCLCAMEVVNTWEWLGKLWICYRRCEKI